MKKLLLLIISFTLLTTAAFAKDTLVVLKTNQGDITIKLLPLVAPKAVENFTTHVKNGYYNGIAFHRVIRGFMVQGGDPTETGMGGKSIWGKPFEDEFNPNYKFDKPGVLAMANSGKNTNGSQFFITVEKTPWLNFKHTIFGYVVDGYDIVEKISNVKVDGNSRPYDDQILVKAYIKK
ncbi:Peptidylprolyl isomerase [Denitrovibrio acetiphilus DSM 12809]|uniref:Peptidyl-prolyl cis-trans isomerase n=1 Tax=Denitrovibrio acetiphilus (strain DSM 12809 / NBRC 114555 / N2460) TaxID=522772 RepID=D4H6U8_DENA2|nr:peptidylprolyl isomerase [Denitrovibrio acetiphilus]ADD67814.1 Peptidylprolyl isomerase [Denitrovibrio acetiphilus DSM 12809]